MSAEENKAVVRRFFEAWQQGNMEEVYALLAPDYVNHREFPPIAPGREGFKQLIANYGTALATHKHEVNDLFAAEDDRVITRITVHATHVGDFMGIPATGKRVKTTAINIMRIADGMIVEQWEESDLFGFLLQLGAKPVLVQEEIGTSSSTGHV